MQKIKEYLESRKITFVSDYNTIDIQNLGIPLFYIRKYKDLYLIYYYLGMNSSVSIGYCNDSNIISILEKLIRNTFPKTKEIDLNRTLYREYIRNILYPEFIDYYIC